MRDSMSLISKEPCCADILWYERSIFNQRKSYGLGLLIPSGSLELKCSFQTIWERWKEGRVGSSLLRPPIPTPSFFPLPQTTLKFLWGDWDRQNPFTSYLTRTPKAQLGKWQGAEVRSLQSTILSAWLGKLWLTTTQGYFRKFHPN